MILENEGHGRPIVISLIAIGAGAIAILWSWNTLAVDLFGSAETECRHAIAVAMALIAICFPVGRSSRFGRSQEG